MCREDGGRWVHRRHAIKGHEFGLRLDAIEREQLIAFLRTL